MIVYCGLGYSGELNDLWELSLSGTPTWAQLLPSGSVPDPRSLATAMYDPVRDRMVTLGGVKFQSTYGDVRYLSLAGTPAWTFGPPVYGRAGHSAIYDPVHDRMVVFGGSSAFGELRADAWMLTWGMPLAADVTQPELGILFAPPRPNPARSVMTFEVGLERPARVRVEIFDPLGRRVRVLCDGIAPAGHSTLGWDLRSERGARVAAGVYVARLEVDGTTRMRRLVVIE